MDIRRYGSQRNRGTTCLIENLTFSTGNRDEWDDTVRWNPNSRSVTIRGSWIRHADGKTHHNYAVSLTLKDISALLQFLAHASDSPDAKFLRYHLRRNTSSIVELLLRATNTHSSDKPKRKKRKSRRRSRVTATTGRLATG